MRSFFFVDFAICLVVLIVTLAGFTKAELEQSKNRRGGGGASGLFAFPRVGRSDPAMSQNIRDAEAAAFDALYPPVSSLEDYNDYSKTDIKRASLIAFPRVGRSEAEVRKWARLLALQQAWDKRTGPSATSGLWFGPRLGKRSIDTNEQRQVSASASAADANAAAASQGQKELFGN